MIYVVSVMNGWTGPEYWTDSVWTTKARAEEYVEVLKLSRYSPDLGYGFKIEEWKVNE